MINKSILDLLICPITRKNMIEAEGMLIVNDENFRYCYEIQNDIIILLPEKVKLLDENEWRNLIAKAER